MCDIAVLADFILHAASDRDVLGLSHAVPLSREGIQQAFHRRALQLHPDKAPTIAAAASTTRNMSGDVTAAFAKVVEAREHLLELLPFIPQLWQAASTAPPSSFDGASPSGLVTRPTPCDAPRAAGSSHSVCVESTAAPSPSSFFALKCATFGCLRHLTAADTEQHQSVCRYCRAQPRKCAVFGCMHVGTGGIFCSQHALASHQCPG